MDATRAMARCRRTLRTLYIAIPSAIQSSSRAHVEPGRLAINASDTTIDYFVAQWAIPASEVGGDGDGDAD